MSFQNQINPELWEAIAPSYTTENYTHAIRDGMTFLTEVLRDKSGLDGDGPALVQKAFGFTDDKQPLIKVNRLETQTEKDIQKGLLMVLSGLYSLIRNPRSHERSNDNIETADSIILFLNYLIGLIGGSKASFTYEDLVAKIKEPHFVNDPEYIAELVNTIPSRKLSDALIEVYRAKIHERKNNFAGVISELVKKIPEESVEDFVHVVSEDLQVSQYANVSLVMDVLPVHLWPKIRKMTRIRVENMLLERLKDAWINTEKGRSSGWESIYSYLHIKKIFEFFQRKHQLKEVILNKLNSSDFDFQNYVASYILEDLNDIFEGKGDYVKPYSNCLRNGNKFAKDQLVTYLSKHNTPNAVKMMFVNALQDLTDTSNPETKLAFYKQDGRQEFHKPFLGKFSPQPDNSLNDIPF